MIQRRTVFRAALAVGVPGVAGACSGEAADTRAEPTTARITVEPTDGATGVGVTDKVTVTVADGTLSRVELTNAKGRTVKGKFTEDKSSWSASEPLGYGKTYTYHVTAISTDSKPAEFTGRFQTIKPTSQVRATVNPVDDAVVGVGMPINVRFAAPITNRKAAEKALRVTTRPDVEGSWAWLHDSQVDWRPKEYWPAGTKVQVAANLYGVHYGKGAYGVADVTTRFEIGRNQVVKIHTPDHRMRVYRGGALHASYPASNGKDADPNLNTPNGTVIVMAKEPKARFDNARYGYTNVWKKWAVRISNHGEFIHENEENRANIGKRNTSHGCVNLFESDAKAYYDSAMIGDPVEITGSRADFPTSSDVNDWLFGWQQWKSMSAL